MTSSNVLWTAKEAAAATEGSADRGKTAWIAKGVSIDSRTVEKGDVFIALTTDQADGHNYVADALKKGAVAAVVAHIPENVPDNAPLLVVRDTLEAMRDMGQAARYRTGAKIIAVTGSVGKTGTKEMLGSAFSALGQTHTSKASYNNHWGVPLSLARMHAGTDYGIFEVGMNHAGEIAPLSRQIKPDIAIITTVAAVHIEHFENEEGIADAKAEIFEGMSAGGSAILNFDNEWFSHLRAKAQTRGIDVKSFGESADADAHIVDCLEAANGTRVTARIMGEMVSFTLHIPGRHIAMNALAVLLAVKLAGGDVQLAARAIAKIEPINGRGRREYLNIGDPNNPVTLIDESYNASPVAMKAAFKVLALIDPGRGGRRIAVLGDMLELGKDSARYHADLALPLQAADVRLVYTCGKMMKNLYDSIPQDIRGAHRDTSAELAEIVPDVLVPGDVVMVKGSNGSKMGAVVEALRSLPMKIQKEGRSAENAL